MLPEVATYRSARFDRVGEPTRKCGDDDGAAPLIFESPAPLFLDLRQCIGRDGRGGRSEHLDDFSGAIAPQRQSDRERGGRIVGTAEARTEGSHEAYPRLLVLCLGRRLFPCGLTREIEDLSQPVVWHPSRKGKQGVAAVPSSTRSHDVQHSVDRNDGEPWDQHRQVLAPFVRPESCITVLPGRSY
jgi:hypothetical protein